MEIKNYKPMDKGCLRGRFDVTVPQWGLTLRDCALFEKEGDEWINFPSRPYKAEDGTTKHYACAVMEKEAKKGFDSGCLKGSGRAERGASYRAGAFLMYSVLRPSEIGATAHGFAFNFV